MNAPVDTTDLPAEVVAQLSRAARALSLSEMCAQALADCGGQASLDQLIVSIWHTHRKVIERDRLHSALDYLKRKHRAAPVACGVWRLNMMEDAECAS